MCPRARLYDQCKLHAARQSMINRGESVLIQHLAGLQVGVVGRAYHWSTGNLIKTEMIGQVLQLLELIRRHKTVNRQMVSTGLQVLSQGEHIDVMVSHITQHLFDLIRLLT